MNLTDKAEAIIDALTERQLREMTPAGRRRLADSMQRVLHALDRIDAAPPKAGVLRQLRDGERQP